MIQEIEAAVNFLTRLVGKSVDPGGSKPGSPNSSQTTDQNKAPFLTDEQVQEFSRKLTLILQNRFRNHWYPDRPSRGQAFRCIRINENCSTDSTIVKACQECGITYESLRLPVELTLWIDPNEVTCRFGEHKGSYCIVAKLSDGRQENYVNSINIEELEQQSMEHSKSTFDIIHSRKKRQQAILHQRTKNGTISMFSSSTSSTNYHSHHQSLNGSLSNGSSPAAHIGANSSGHPHAPVTSTTQNLNGYADYGPNGLLPTTTSGGAVPMHQYHSHFGNQQPAPHFYPNSTPNPFQQHHVVQHSTHYGSPTNHLFPKFNMGLQQQSQQGPSQPGQLAGNRALNAASLAASGTFRSNLASNSNSVGSKQVNVYQSPSNSHHNVSAATSPFIASLGASHHSISNGGSGASKSSSTSIATSNANPSSFARGLQTAFNLAAVPFTPSSALANGVVVAAVSANGVVSPSSVASSASPNANGYPWVNNKSIVKA